MKALVTGGGGFLGGAILRKLIGRGDSARSFSRGEHAHLGELGAEHVRGDISDPESVLRAAEGCDLAFHVAAKPGIWGPYEEYHRTNVVGTENVIEACRHLQIPRLVYTSSPSVIFDGTDMEGVDESAPYPDHFEAHYPKTKALAEQRVIEANSEELATVVLRPHLIWGPGDNHLVPRIIARGRAGQLRRIGTRECLVDTAYIDNAADAHLLAADRLSPDSPLAGKRYFISNDDPRPLWDIVNQILATADVPPVEKTIPPWLAYGAGWLMEAVYGLFRIKDEPRMTRFLARELSTAHWFDVSAATRDLGYEPKVSIEEGMQRLRTWIQEGGLEGS